MHLYNHFIALLFITTLLSVSVISALPAFPGAQGWGTETTHGRGGKVYIVDTLDGTGKGSLYWAMSASGPRIIVFRVSGVIETQGFMFGLANSNVMIAGQTSPGGVTLVNRKTPGGIVLSSYASNFGNGVFRFLRLRGLINGNDDCSSFNSTHNLVFDHCEFSGGQDECFSVPVSHDFTVQWCAIHNSTPNTGSSGWGGSLMSNSHVSIHHNLWANNFARYPNTDWSYVSIPDSGRYDMVNNIIYNTQRAYSIGNGGKEKQINMIGNLYLQGPSTEDLAKQVSLTAYVFARDNFMWFTNGTTKDLCSGSGWLNTYGYLRYGDTASTRWPMPEVPTYSATANYDSVVLRVGALPRDTMMRRTIQEVKSRTGIVKTHTYDLLTYAPLPEGPFPQAPSDVDKDGMPDFWESAVGLNPNDSSDATGDFDGSGYTNIEKYINDLALARLGYDYYYPVYPIPSNWSDYNPSSVHQISVEVQRAQGNAQTLVIQPNPFNPTTTIHFSNSSRGAYQLDICNAHGQLIRRITGRGDEHVVWDGQDTKGKLAHTGTYIFRLFADGKVLNGKAFLVK